MPRRKINLKKFKKKVLACTLCGKKFHGTPRLTSPKGYLDADTVMLMPAPTIPDMCEANIMFSSKAHWFLDTLLDVGGFDARHEGLQVPVTFCISKMTVTCARNCFEFTSLFLTKAKLVIVCGNDVYKAFFNDGGIPELLYGTGHKEAAYPYPFFFFSDYRKVDLEEAYENDYWRRRIVKEIRAFKSYTERRR